MDNKGLELAKKVKALVNQGVGGEKENAETLLREIMEKV